MYEKNARLKFLSYFIMLLRNHTCIRTWLLSYLNSNMFSKEFVNTKHFALRIPEMDAECMYVHRQ